MEFKELKKKSESELQKLLAEQREKLREMRFKDANKQLKDVRQIRAVRTEIAQILTLINVFKKNNPVSISKKVNNVADSKIEKVAQEQASL